MKTPGKVLLGIALFLLIVSFVSCSSSFEKSSKLSPRERFANGGHAGSGDFMLGLASLVGAVVCGVVSCGFIKEENLQKWSGNQQIDSGQGGLRQGGVRRGKSTASHLKKAYKENLREPFAAPRRMKSSKKKWY